VTFLDIQQVLNVLMTCLEDEVEQMVPYLCVILTQEKSKYLLTLCFLFFIKYDDDESTIVDASLVACTPRPGPRC
jgi:hypothetical protein